MKTDITMLIIHQEVDETGSPDDLDVLVQVEQVRNALTLHGYSVQVLPVTLNLHRLADVIQQTRPLLVFNLVESLDGKDRLLYLPPAILEAYHVPFTGSGSDPLYRTTGKLLAKEAMQMAGVDTPPWFTAPLRDQCDIIQGTYILKSAWDHASLGLDDNSVITIDGASTLPRVCSDPSGPDAPEMYLETYIEGREFNISLLETPHGVRVLPPAEICFSGYPENKPRIVGYSAKWDTGSFEYTATSRSFCFTTEDSPLLGELSRIACRCWQVFNLSGYARVDFRVDVQGVPWVLEVNANPCLAEDAGFMASAHEAGISQTEVIHTIVQSALNMKRNTYVQDTPCIR